MDRHTIDIILNAWRNGDVLDMTTPDRFHIAIGDSRPVFGFALHAGDEIREDLQPRLNLSRLQMLKEEDPRTDELLAGLPNRIRPLFSRFQCDLNRPKRGRPVETAVYTSPDLAWELEVCRPPLKREEVTRLLEPYRAFYDLVETIAGEIQQRFDRGLFIDMHSYNNRGRQGLPDINEDRFRELNSALRKIFSAIYLA